LLGLGAENLAARLRVAWNDRMRTTVGRADFQRSLILLNPALQKFGAAEIDRTLRHELAQFASTFSLSAANSPARTGMAQSLFRPWNSRRARRSYFAIDRACSTSSIRLPVRALSEPLSAGAPASPRHRLPGLLPKVCAR
jgi:hypothetical protein